ncbi:hypothetical protein, partial [Methylobacterium goesingense]|uniref:hypothetical protein n=1 Tax=Methylobacterium goesingense TaxID=243690 RepID=UPI00362F2136
LRVRLLASPHIQLLWSWLILSISPVQSQPVRSGLKDVLLGPAQLYEALRGRSGVELAGI